jgi:hypothetical protein
MLKGNKNRSDFDSLTKRAATLELLIFQLQQRAQPDYHQSELAERSLENAQASLAEALSQMARETSYDKNHSERLLNVCYFYTHLAENIINSETTENLVGESHYFDLLETNEDRLKQAQSTFKQLDEALNTIEKIILSR